MTLRASFSSSPKVDRFKSCLFLSILMLFAGPLCAQSKRKEKNDSTSAQFCKPSLANSPRPQFLEISRTSSYFYNATAQNYLNNSEETKKVVSNDKLTAKLKFPIIMTPGFSMFGALGYSSETYAFEKSNLLNEDTHTFLSNIDEQNLKGITGKVYVTKPFRGNKFLFARVGVKFQGDFHETHSPFNSYLNYEGGLMYGWKKSDDFVMGAGLAVTNNFGRFSVYPLFAYQRNFDNNLTLEALLPAVIQLRYTTPDQRNIFYSGAEANGSNYRINQEGIMPGATGSIVWQNANVDFKLGYKREIHDWLWINVEAGVRQNLRSRIRYPEEGGSEAILNCNWDNSMVFKAGIFLVPPRKLLEKH